MKKLIKNDKFKDILCIFTLILFYFLVLGIITKGGKYILGSNVDFSMQHYTIPEYFRTLFYNTHDILPDFAFNLGAGENIYYLSYYGFLSPITLISYLFPFVNMLNFTIISMIIVIIASIILLYFYLRKNNYTRIICFLCTFIFLCSAPLIFHSHRHIMFVNYFPFLIMGFYGIDKFVKDKKSFLLIISTTLMIFTSYYYSVSGICVLFILGIYKYLKYNSFKFKDLFKFILSLILRIGISVLISSILIIPTLYTLFSGRNGESISLNLIDLFKPNMYMLHSNYSLGLTTICLIGTICMLFSKEKENKFLSIIILLVSIFPIFNYVLNGFLYINAKSLIPFILLIVLLMAECLTVWFKNNIIKYLIGVIIILSSARVCIDANIKENWMFKSDINNDFNKNYSKYVINEDDNLYRTNTSLMGKTYINKVGNIREYKTTMYSSAFNKDYRLMYKDLFSNPLAYRNKFMLSSSNNILFQMYMGDKYIYSKENYDSIYEKIYSNENVNIYKNDYVLPVGYATSRIVNKDDFDKLNYPDNVINLLGNVVTDEETNMDIINSEILNLDYELKTFKNVEYEKTDYGYYLKAEKGAKIELKLNNDLNNKLLFIDFDILENVSCKNPDLTIKINDVTNKLTCRSWKYFNENEHFSYVLFGNDTLSITLEKGKYKLGNIQFRTLDVDYLKNIRNNIDEFIFDKDKTKGDKIVGNIDVKEDGYFTLSIPYDKGFNIFIDGKKVDYTKVNGSFIGFRIDSGKHYIEIIYEAPLKRISIVFSLIGIISLIIVCLIERRRKNGFN